MENMELFLTVAGIITVVTLSFIIWKIYKSSQEIKAEAAEDVKDRNACVIKMWLYGNGVTSSAVWIRGNSHICSSTLVLLNLNKEVVAQFEMCISQEEENSDKILSKEYFLTMPLSDEVLQDFSLFRNTVEKFTEAFPN